MRRLDWQDDQIERMESLLDDESDPPEIGDFGFWHDADDVFDFCNILVLSRYRILPEEGGWLDQDERWSQDIKTWLWLRYRLQWERKHEGRDVGRSLVQHYSHKAVGFNDLMRD